MRVSRRDRRGAARSGARRPAAGDLPSRKAVAVPARQFDQGLPPAARSRLAEIRTSGTWGSALSTDEFAAIKSVGFEPVGQVLGAAVYNIGFTGGYNCPGAWGAWGSGGP